MSTELIKNIIGIAKTLEGNIRLLNYKLEQAQQENKKLKEQIEKLKERL